MKIDIKKIKKPSKEQIEFFQQLELDTIKHTLDCMDNNNIIEGYFYLWSLIEQVLVPQLIIFIANRLKISIPKFLFYSNQSVIQGFYLALSHDTKLYNLLEKGRQNRNNITHKLVHIQDKNLLQKKIKENIKNDFKIWNQISKRLTGKEIIPVLTLYANGWNDNRKRIIKVAEKWGVKIE